MRTSHLDIAQLSRALGFATGWLVMGLVGVVARGIDLPAAGAFWSVRLVHHLVDFGRHAAVALAVFATVLAWGHFAARERPMTPWKGRLLAAFLVTLLALGLAALLVVDDVAGMAERLSETTSLPEGLLQAALTCAIALAVPAAVLVGPVFTTHWRRWIPVVVFAATFWINATTSPRDNPGLHLYLSWFGATLLGFSCRWPSAWVQAAVERPRWLTTAGAVLGVLALVGVALPLSNSQRVDLALWDTNLLPGVALGRTAFSTAQAASAESNPFFLPKGQAPAVPPRPQQLLPKDGVVLLLSIDGIRADVVGPEKKQLFPNLYRLYDNGTHFSNVWSPGSATVYTLSAVSTGETFSERYWTKTKGDYWPYQDEAVHFPALLTAAGISTLHARSTSWLENGRRLMSGFQEERYPKTDWKWVKGKELADALISMLRKHESGPAFAFAHFLDTHHPYRPGRKKSKSPFEQYLYSLSYVDKQLGRVLDAVNKYGMADRVIVIVTADHGEAFGEHGTHTHATTLYEEQVRVPLVFWGPTIPKQERSEHVTLLDLGPTVLELFRQPTPGTFLGQSLVPALEGKELVLQRPIIAEARLLQSMVFDDGIKVIRNRKSGVVEVYDLNEDPKEADNLSDEDAGRFQPRVDRLIQFFDAHTLKRPGYRVPLRK